MFFHKHKNKTISFKKICHTVLISFFKKRFSS